MSATPAPATTLATVEECAAGNNSPRPPVLGNNQQTSGDNSSNNNNNNSSNMSQSASQGLHSPATPTSTADTSNSHQQPQELTDTVGVGGAGRCIPTPPPSYSGPPGQPIFLPYITQELPHYTDITGPAQGHTTTTREARLGFIGHSGHYTPVQIPGYISTEDHHHHHPTHSHVQSTSGHYRHVQSHPPSRHTQAHAPDIIPATPSNDYMTVTFALLLCCIIHLNIPAVLLALSALAFSIKTRELNTSRMYGEAEKHSKIVLICNSLAVIEYAVIGVSAATVLALIFIFDFQLFQL